MIVGFIGLGTMGAPMARNLLEEGPSARSCYDVQPPSVASADRGGARPRRPRRGRSRPRSEVVITMLPDAPDVERVALGPDGIVAGIRPGSIYIDMSTIDPGTTRKVGAAIAAKGAAMIDSPVGKTADRCRGRHADADGRRRRGRSSRVAARCSTAWAPISSIAASSASGQTMKLINNLLAHGGVGGIDRSAGRRHRRAGSRSKSMMSVLRTTMAWNNAARDRAAEAAAGRRFQSRLHDEARAQGLPPRIADGRGARRHGTGWTCRVGERRRGRPTRDCRTTTSARCSSCARKPPASKCACLRREPAALRRFAHRDVALPQLRIAGCDADSRTLGRLSFSRSPGSCQPARTHQVTGRAHPADPQECPARRPVASRIPDRLPGRSRPTTGPAAFRSRSRSRCLLLARIGACALPRAPRMARRLALPAT